MYCRGQSCGRMMDLDDLIKVLSISTFYDFGLQKQLAKTVTLDDTIFKQPLGSVGGGEIDLCTLTKSACVETNVSHALHLKDGIFWLALSYGM